jgi:hypothetical protein
LAKKYIRHGDELQREKTGELKEQGYGEVYQCVMRDNTLSAPARCLYAYISTFTDAINRVAFPSISLIKFELGYSRNSIFKYLRELKESGYIDVSQVRSANGTFKHNLYTILKFRGNDVRGIDKSQSQPCTNQRYTAERDTVRRDTAERDTVGGYTNSTINNNTNINITSDNKTKKEQYSSPSSFPSLWDNCLNIIRERIGDISFKTWFDDLDIAAEDKKVTIAVHNKLSYEVFSERFITVVSTVLNEVSGQYYDVELEVRK